MLKTQGMKTTGKKATLMKRLHMRGGEVGMGTTASDIPPVVAETKEVPTHKVKKIGDKYSIVAVTDEAVVGNDTIKGNTEGFASVDEAKEAFNAANVPGAILDSAPPTEEGGKRRRRRRSRRREGGGKRRGRKSRRGAEVLGY
jgi:hypothetical protein